MSHVVHLRPASAALSAIALLAMLAPPQSVDAQDAAKGSMLLADARKALGGDDKLATIKRLQVSGTFLRSTGPDQVVDGDFDVFIELPDKYRRDEITGFAGANAERTEVLNGADVWDESSGGLTAGRGLGGGGGFPRGGRGGGGDRGGGGGGFRGGGFDRGRNPNQNAGAPQADAGAVEERAKEQQRRTRQAELARLVLVWLLTTDGPVTWIGTAQAPEGTADVLELRPANAVPTRLFLEPMTHLPLMITWSGQPTRGGDIRRRGAGAPALAAQGQTTLELHMGDYKTVNGIKLPHLITRGPEGITQEELKVKSFKFNPNFKANTFVQ
jgi:hypothetical protein